MTSLCLLLFVPYAAGQGITDVRAPFYSAASVVNAATQTGTDLAPYTIATIYGVNLSFTTRALSASDAPGGNMPNNLDGVDVYVNRSRTSLFYVSPTQINFLVPAELLKGDYELQVLRSGVAGPVVTLHLQNFAPGLFVYNGNSLIATHADGTLITKNLPAAVGEIIVLYAVGLGPTTPLQYSLVVPSRAATLVKGSPLQVIFDGVTVSASDILYAGVTPGCAGLYQINLRVPSGIGETPSVTVQFGSIASPAASLSSVKI